MRVLGAVTSWFLFVLSFTLLYRVSGVVMGLGGSCASGGPYEIAVECPGNVALFAPLSIWGGLIAVAIAIVFTQGFAVQLTTWAWPILFCGLGFAFVLSRDPTGYLVGGVFLVMGLVPLVLEVRASPQRVLLGRNSADGARFYEGERARKSLLSPGTPNPQGAVQPNAGHWLLGLAVPVISGALGYLLAGILFTAAVG